MDAWHTRSERSSVGCDDCGAEIEYRAPCNCPPSEQEKHAHVCCGKEMRILGVESESEKPGAQKKSAA